MSPDPFDDPHGYIDRRTVDGIRAFQQANKLPNTGLMFAGSDGEAALREAVALLKRDRAPDFVAYQARKAAADMEEIRTIFDRLGLDLDAAVERYGDGNAGPRIVPAGFAGGLPRADPDAFNPRRRRERMFSPGAGGGPGQPSGQTWAPPLRAAPNTWERAPELIDPDAGGVGPPPAAAERSDPPTLAERLREPGMKGFVPWSWPDKQRELDAIVVENRGNASTQEQDHRVTQETMKRARKVEERMKCDIVHFSGARRLEADKEGPAGSDRPQKHVYRHDAEGREIRIARGSSRPDMIFVASPSGRRLVINTYSHGTASNEPNAWERHSRDTLVGNLPNGDVVLLVPKPGPGEMLDPVKLGAVVEPLLEEICRQYVPGTEYQRLHTAPDVNRKID